MQMLFWRSAYGTISTIGIAAKNGFSVIREVEQEEGTILLAEKCL